MGPLPLFSFGKIPIQAKPTVGPAGDGTRLQRKAAGGAAAESAAPAASSLGDHLPLRGPLAPLAKTAVQPVAGLVEDHQALAQARNGGIEVDASMAGAPAGDVRSLLAHEAIHVAQQSRTEHPAPASVLETEASRLSGHVLAGRPVWPVLSGRAAMPLRQPPGKPKEPSAQELRDLDDAWKKAMGPKKIKLDHLKAQLNYLQQLRKLIRERQPIETQRSKLDTPNTHNRFQSDSETNQLTQKSVNRRPIKTHVTQPQEETPGEIDITVNVQARFLGRKVEDVKTDFEKLRTSLATGMHKIWGQTLAGMPSLVKDYEFNVSPAVTLVDAAAPRDNDFWQIEVDPATPRAHTEAMESPGVMHINSSDISKPDTLGHESLHWFGFLDRYYDNPNTGHSESIRGTPTRSKRGAGTGVMRDDPLDTGKGPILTEDLEYMFARSRVYEQILIANMTPYDLALIRQLGWGRVPALTTLLDQSDNEAGEPDPPQKAPPLSKQTPPLSGREKSDPQAIILKKVDGLIAAVNMDIDNFALREHMLDLPDMAPPAQKAP